MITSAKGTKYRNSARRVLIVDDERDLAETLADILDARGYETEVAYSATGARKKLKSFRPKVALIDIRLGRSNGVDLIDDVKKADPRALCVMMTAFAGVETAVDALQKGAYDYLRKPLNAEDLLATLDRCFEISGLEEEKSAVERDNALLAMAVEQSAEIILITDVEGTIQYVNPTFEKVTGYTRGEAVGKNPRILKSGKQDRAFYKEMWNTLTRGEVWQGRLVNKKKDGSLYEEDATISSLRDRKGNIVNYVGSKRDVTREVQLEARLRQAQKLESIGTLAGGIAHDFNNLLLPIIGFTDMVREELPENSESRKNLEKVVKAARRASDLIRQILTFSRKVETDRKPVLVQPIIQETLKLLRAAIPPSIEIVQTIKVKSRTVLADPTQIHQLVMNLCTNAYQAMEKDEKGKLEVRLDSVRTDGDFAAAHPYLQPDREYLRLSVSDTGHGMDKETQQRIFDPFFTTKEHGKGTGLGLSTTHGIVASLNGALSVYSEPGKGSTFNVYLPLFEIKEATAPVDDDNIPLGDGEKILLVDDEPFVLAYGKQLLEKIGYDVTAVSNCEEAIELFRSDPGRFDLVVTDQTMPKLTGAQICAEIQKTHPDLPIILTSGFSETLTQSNLKTKNIRKILMKPYTRKGIALAIQEALGKKR